MVVVMVIAAAVVLVVAVQDVVNMFEYASSLKHREREREREREEGGDNAVLDCN